LWKSKPVPQELTPQNVQEMAQTSDATMAWEQFPDGDRSRWWCKICRDEGKDWIFEPTCEHVKNAGPGHSIPKEQAQATIRKLMEQNPITPAKSESQP
jgi:hypothetical protein